MQQVHSAEKQMMQSAQSLLQELLRTSEISSLGGMACACGHRRAY